MSAAVLPPPAGIGFAPRKKFTRDEVEQMLDSGIFAGQRFELIDGDLIDKMGQKQPHVRGIQLVLGWLFSLFGVDRVLGQAPIDAAAEDRERNCPEPDAVLLGEWKPDFGHRPPRGDELRLAIEVSDTTFYTDAATKRDLYAGAGIPEYWIIDLNGRRIIVHRSPLQGVYTQISVLGENESITLEGHSIEIAQLLPLTRAC
jgi:Uma2 family endonuclease